MGLPNPFRKTKFSGANGDREIFILPGQLTASRVGNLKRLILDFDIRDDDTYMHTYSHNYYWYCTVSLTRHT